MKKSLKIDSADIVDLIPSMGGCIASDKITVEGLPVGFMYREEPEEGWDSGWRFLSGTETEEYIDDAENSGIYDVNTIANYDRAIIPYLNLPNGTELERIEGTDTFQPLPPVEED
jgi:hypothetical protein